MEVSREMHHLIWFWYHVCKWSVWEILSTHSQGHVNPFIPQPFPPLPPFFFLFRQSYDPNVSICILCLSAGWTECRRLPEDGMCQPHSSHQELLQGAVNAVNNKDTGWKPRQQKSPLFFTLQNISDMSPLTSLDSTLCPYKLSNHAQSILSVVLRVSCLLFTSCSVTVFVLCSKWSFCFTGLVRGGGGFGWSFTVCVGTQRHIIKWSSGGRSGRKILCVWYIRTPSHHCISCVLKTLFI